MAATAPPAGTGGTIPLGVNDARRDAMGWYDHASLLKEFVMPRHGPISLMTLVLLVAPASPAVAEEPLPVTTRPAGDLFIPIGASAPARTVPLQQTRVPARLAAPVDRIERDVGERVERGDALVRLECVDAESARDAATARLAELRARARLAELRLQRVQRLHAQDAASADELDQAEAENAAATAAVAAARAELERAQRDVSRCDVTAPAGGVITARHVAEGDFVQPGTVLVTLVADEDLELRADVTASDADALLAAENIEFRAGDTTFSLERPRRTGVVDSRTGTEEIRLRFRGALPRPGRAGRIHWHVARTAVPARLVVRRGGSLGVFTVAEGRARFHELPDAVEGRPAATSLAPDARLLIEGRHAATDGMPLKIVE